MDRKPLTDLSSQAMVDFSVPGKPELGAGGRIVVHQPPFPQVTDPFVLANLGEPQRRRSGNLTTPALPLWNMPVSRAFLAALLLPFLVSSQPAVTTANWGSLATPVYGSAEPSFPPGTELITGPNRFGSYFSGVLPNGRTVKPAGISLQIGMNPLGAALTPDGRFLVTSNDSSHSALASQKNPMNVGGYSLSVIDTASMKLVSQFSSRIKLDRKSVV